MNVTVDIHTKGEKDKIERIQKWGNGSLKELHCNKYRKEEEN